MGGALPLQHVPRPRLCRELAGVPCSWRLPPEHRLVIAGRSTDPELMRLRADVGALHVDAAALAFTVAQPTEMMEVRDIRAGSRGARGRGRHGDVDRGRALSDVLEAAGIAPARRTWLIRG